MTLLLRIFTFACLLSLAGCATTGGGGTPPVDVSGADVSSKTLANGDTVQEYRVSGQLRMVKVTPARGAAYYLYDSDGDGRLDKSKDNVDVSPVYWKLYGW